MPKIRNIHILKTRVGTFPGQSGLARVKESFLYDKKGEKCFRQPLSRGTPHSEERRAPAIAVQAGFKAASTSSQ